MGFFAMQRELSLPLRIISIISFYGESLDQSIEQEIIDQLIRFCVLILIGFCIKSIRLIFSSDDKLSKSELKYKPIAKQHLLVFYGANGHAKMLRKLIQIQAFALIQAVQNFAKTICQCDVPFHFFPYLCVNGGQYKQSAMAGCVAPRKNGNKKALIVKLRKI